MIHPKIRPVFQRCLALMLCMGIFLQSSGLSMLAAELPASETASQSVQTEESGYAEIVEGSFATLVTEAETEEAKQAEEIACTQTQGCTLPDGHEGDCQPQADLTSAEADLPTAKADLPTAKADLPTAQTEDFVISSGVAANGFAGTRYDFLANATVTPAQDADGDTVLLRIRNITSTDSAFAWDGGAQLIAGAAGTTYTICYEAYTLADEQKTVCASQDFAFTSLAKSDIGDRLDGDYAYISNVSMVKDATTESGTAIRTGTAPFDDESENGTPGNDTTTLDNTLRTFDLATYTLAINNKVRSNAPYRFYHSGVLCFEFVLQGTSAEAMFDVGAMGWLTAKKEAEYTITEETRNGEPCQVLRGSYLWEPSDQNPSAIGESYQELTVAVRALALKNGDTLAPEFTFWMQHNTVPTEGLVTDAATACDEHGEVEPKTLAAPKIAITAAPRYNVRLGAAASTVSYTGTFDFSTGNELALNKTAGTVNGRANVFGITLQIVGKTAAHGLRGCEIPTGDITFDLTLGSSFTPDGTTTKVDVTDSYTPLVWSLDINRRYDGQIDKRVIDGKQKYARLAAPLGIIVEGVREYEAVYNSGSFSGEQTGNKVSVTVSGYEIDLTKLPYADVDVAATEYNYYDFKTINNYWEVQNACFAAGELWVVQPFCNNTTGKHIMDTYKDGGTFAVSLKDTNLMATSISGKSLEKATGNTNQMKTDDDAKTLTYYLSSQGTIQQYINYNVYNSNGYNAPLTAGCFTSGKDWVSAGAKVGIRQQISHNSGEGDYTGVAYDLLTKFDDVFFQPDGTVLQNDTLNVVRTKYLYGAKPDKDKQGWDHKGLEPGEAGHDDEMINATAEDLIYFSTLAALKKAGYTCVAVLGELRGVVGEQENIFYYTINGTAKTSAPANSVYMITHCGRAWRKSDVQAAAAAYCDVAVAELTNTHYNKYVKNLENKDGAFPSRADLADTVSYEGNYPTGFWAREYQPAQDGQTSQNGYVKAVYNDDGSVSNEGVSARKFGDSCLLVPYRTNITKKPAQTTSAGIIKTAYDMDTSQRIVDFALNATVLRGNGTETGGVTSGNQFETTVFVQDTLPAGLSYIPNSSYYGGAYEQTGEGKRGTVVNGMQLEPDVTNNADGTTTLLWTLENVTVTNQSITNLPVIRYSCDIGRAGDDENDVKNGDSLVNTAIIWSNAAENIAFSAAAGNQTTASILVSKNNATSLSKLAEQTAVDKGEEMGFVLNVGNNSSNAMPIIALDSLPYNNDAAGSAFTGDCRVTQFAITALADQFADNFELYYTTDETQRGKTSDDYTAADFTEANGWKKLAVNTTNGTVTLPEGSFMPVAIAAVGTLAANTTLKMHVSLLLPDGQPGDYITNRLTQSNMESYARSYVVSRTLEGVVWNDANENGLRGTAEALVNGVSATLMQLKAGGDATKQSDYEPYQVAGANATVQTGAQMDVITGTKTDYVEGGYKFTNLPNGTFGVLFANGSFIMDKYTASPVAQGDNRAIDSDAVPSYDAALLASAFIAGIAMPETDKITSVVFASRNNDFGLFRSFVSVSVEKMWDDANNQDGVRPESVTINLLADGEETELSLTLNEENDWADTFTNLDKYSNSEEITYTIEEVTVANYTVSITGDAEDGYTVTNTHTPEKVSIPVEKVWNDANNQDGVRPESVTINLLADGEETELSLTLNEENDWADTFTNLDKYSDGDEIVYTIEEVTVANYTVSITGDAEDGYTVTNTHTPKPIQTPTPTPTSTTVVPSPSTGDLNSYAFWAVLLALAFTGVVATAATGKKKKD